MFKFLTKFLDVNKKDTDRLNLKVQAITAVGDKYKKIKNDQYFFD